MRISRATLAQALACILIAASCGLARQTEEPRPYALAPAESERLFTEQQLDQMLAPIALYPDPLIAQILMASTYPLEVVEADRWLHVPANASLKGDALAAALEKQPWDPSVKSLIPFPRILGTMDDHLDWTVKLGDAFLAQEADVMNSVQRLRQKAKAAGALVSTPDQVVTAENGVVLVQPANPQIVYLPVYNPWLVYGPWPWPGYPPYYFWPWPGFAIGYWSFPVFYPYWGWCRPRWRHRRVDIDVNKFNRINVHRPPVTSPIWQHSPAHRHSVPYRDAGTRMRFQGPVPQQTLRATRGYPVAAPAAVHAPPVFESFGRGAEVQSYSQRGASSMGGFGAGGGRGGGGGGRR